MFKLGPRTSSKGKLIQSTPQSNPISQLYFSFLPHFAFGPGGMWKVFQAKSVSNQSDACILFYDKYHSAREKSKNSKCLNHPPILELLKRDLNMLVSFQHQRILKTLSAVCENETSVAIAVEPVIGTLMSIARSNFKKLIMHEIEIKCGLLQLAEGLAYLHGSFKLHGDFTPHNILITPHYSWKIAGFSFSKSSIDRSENYLSCPWQKSVPVEYLPKLDFYPPENLVRKCVSKEADIFSFGAMICWIYASGVPIIDAKDNLEIYRNHLQEIKTTIESLRSKMGPTLTDAVYKMLKEVPEERPTAQLITMIKHFDDPAASSLWKFVDLNLKDEQEQNDFLGNTLPHCIESIPEDIWLKRIIPDLSAFAQKAAIKESSIWPLLKMVQRAHHKQTLATLLPIISELIVQASADQPKLLSALLGNTDILFSKMEDTVIQQYLLDLCLEALETDATDLQISAFSGLSKIKSYLTVAYLRKKILPSIKRCFARPSCSLKVILAALVCVDSLLPVVDSASIPIIVSLSQNLDIKDPKIAVAVTRLFQKILLESVRLHVGEELASTKMLPTLSPALTAKGLTDAEFNVISETCSEILEYIFHGRYKRPSSVKDDNLEVALNGTRPQRHSIGTFNNRVPELLVTAHGGHTCDQLHFNTFISRNSLPTKKEKLVPEGEPRRLSSPVNTSPLGPSSTLHVAPEAQGFNRDRRRKSANDILKFNPNFDIDENKRKSISVTSILKYPSRSSSASSTPGRRLSLVGAKQNTFTNFGHNLACTLWGNNP